MITTVLMSLASKILPALKGKLGVYLIVAGVLGGAGYHYKNQVYQEGYLECQREGQALALKTQEKVEKETASAIAQAKADWQKWHLKELDKIKADRKTEVVYETIIERISETADLSVCPDIGVDALGVFNDSIKLVSS